MDLLGLAELAVIRSRNDIVLFFVHKFDLDGTVNAVKVSQLKIDRFGNKVQ